MPSRNIPHTSPEPTSNKPTLPESLSRLLGNPRFDDSERVELILSSPGSTLSELGREMYRFLEDSIVGQPDAKRKIAEIVSSISSRSGQTRKGTIANLMFVGPSGVGKSTTPQLIAEFLLGNRDAITRIDGGTLRSHTNSTSLFGSNPQYAGADIIPILHSTNIFSHFKKSKNNKALHPSLRGMGDFAILVIDEIDKVDTSIIDSLYALMDENEIKLFKGEKLPTRNILIIYTTNLGQQEYRYFMENGADRKRFQDDSIAAVGKMKQVGNAALKKHFNDGFLSRVEVVHFNELTGDEVLMAVENELKAIEAKYTRNETKILIHRKNIVPYIFSFYDATLGVRPIVKKIADTIIPIIESYRESKDFSCYMDLPKGTEIIIFLDTGEIKGKVQINKDILPYVENKFELVLQEVSGIERGLQYNLAIIGLLSLIRLKGLASKEGEETIHSIISEKMEGIDPIISSIFSGNIYRIQYLLEKCSFIDLVAKYTDDSYFLSIFRGMCGVALSQKKNITPDQKDSLEGYLARCLYLEVLSPKLENIFEDVYRDECESEDTERQ